MPMTVISLVSLLTPFNLMSIPGVTYSGVFFIICAEFVMLYGMHKGKVNNRSQ